MSSAAAFDLAAVCPRLALAHRQRRHELHAERAERHKVRELLRHAEWCVAHRELQLVRAGFTRNGRYIASRTRKLGQARRDLARLESYADRIGALGTTRQAA